MKFSGLLGLQREDLLNVLTPEAMLTLNLVIDLYETKQYAQIGLKCYHCKAQNHLAPECPLARISINRGRIQKRWLEKRQYQAKLLQPSSVSPNYPRRMRKTRRFRHYSLANVHCDRGYSRLRGANYTLTKRLTMYSPGQGEDSVEILQPDNSEELEFCPLPVDSDSSSSDVYSDYSDFSESKPLTTFPTTTCKEVPEILSKSVIE